MDCCLCVSSESFHLTHVSPHFASPTVVFTMHHIFFSTLAPGSSASPSPLYPSMCPTTATARGGLCFGRLGEQSPLTRAGCMYIRPFLVLERKGRQLDGSCTEAERNQQFHSVACAGLCKENKRSPKAGRSAHNQYFDQCQTSTLCHHPWCLCTGVNNIGAREGAAPGHAAGIDIFTTGEEGSQILSLRLGLEPSEVALYRVFFRCQ